MAVLIHYRTEAGVRTLDAKTGKAPKSKTQDARTADGQTLKVKKSCPAENDTDGEGGRIPAGTTVEVLGHTDKGVSVRWRGKKWHIDDYDANQCLTHDSVQTHDCGCGGKKTDDASAGEIGALYDKLDKMTPEELTAAAEAKGIVVTGKTPIIMALLRADFTTDQVRVWAEKA